MPGKAGGKMGSIRTAIELQDNFTGILYQVIDSVNLGLAAMEDLHQTMNASVETASMDAARDSINQATMAVQQLDAAMQAAGSFDPGISAAPESPVTAAIPVSAPVDWQTDSMEVFTGSGIERFQQEVQSTNSMLYTLGQTQSRIAASAAQTDLFPPGMEADMSSLQYRMQEIQNRMQAIANNPLNMGTNAANAEMERLRAQFTQAVQEQENLNQAVENMDVRAANEAYLRLSQTVGSTERYIRDNVDEQGRFNRALQDGMDGASGLKNMISSVAGAYIGMAGLKKAREWIDDCTAAFNTQLNAETQLISVLANMSEGDYAASVEMEVGADTTAAVDEINGIQNEVDGVSISVTAETKALTDAYEQITEKASEIQGRGIYGDEAMIAAAAEFSTYFTDTDAIEMMMDTLADYAMGMTGGGEIDSTGMVDYATNLGKIMSGSYDAMTKKGFEFTDAQKAIIEGEATREQIVAALGEEYVDMSGDMQAAAAISQVIDESWSGLYESMSNTPEGKIIQMTNTWGDMKEVIGGQLYPYVLLFVDAITENWSTIQTVVDGITTGLEYMLGFFSWLVEGAIGFAQVVIDNWGWISPIIYGIIGALAVYNTYLAITKGLELASAAAKGVMAVWEGIHAAAVWATTGATWAEVTAQNGLNAAMYACPVVWIIVLIIALIAIFYAAVAAVNHFAGTSVSATGIIAGAFAIVGAHIINTFVVPVWNAIVAFINFFGNVFNDKTAAIKVLFYDMCLTVIGYIQNLASAIEILLNKIPGVTVDITSGLDSFYAGLEQAQRVVKDESGWVEYAHKMDFVDYEDAANAGYAFGQGIEERIANFDPSSLFGVEGIPSADEYANEMAGNGLGEGVNDIEENTGKMADSMDITGEELKYLRDIAEQETVNRFTTAEIHLSQTNHNMVKSGMDLDGVLSGLDEMLGEAGEIMAEGVHV